MQMAEVAEPRWAGGKEAARKGGFDVNIPLLQAIAAVMGAFAALLGGIYAVVTRPILGRLDDIVKRLERIEVELKTHGERITRMEERIPPAIHC